ncbi:MAG: HAD family phosphatase [Anaerolineae bacterium]|nr:HAD family phosphatase [Anaerolineae bacterium]
MRFEAIIFDFNGVLLWDSHLQERAWRQFSAQIRDTPFSKEEMDVHVHGRNNCYTLEYLVGYPVEGDQLQQLVQQKETIYKDLCLEQGSQFRLSPGATDLLDFLLTRQIPHTIATASGKMILDFFVTQLELDRWFEVEQIVYDDGTRPGKPAPDIYQQAARNVEVNPSRCVVVEDSRSGIEAAHTAGIGYIIALGPKHVHSDLIQLDGVNQAVEDLHQVPRRLFL